MAGEGTGQDLAPDERHDPVLELLEGDLDLIVGTILAVVDDRVAQGEQDAAPTADILLVRQREPRQEVPRGSVVPVRVPIRRIVLVIVVEAPPGGEGPLELVPPCAVQEQDDLAIRASVLRCVGLDLQIPVLDSE
jgi:hypothetical protein